jgi:hypothetical protein
MPLYPLYDKSKDPPIPTNLDIPKEMDIFFREESNFLPKGKTFDDLTEEEKKDLRNKYRFDPMKPGVYQGISGFGKMLS